jgi:hypothetical protein
MNNKARGARCTDFLVNKSDFRQQQFVHSDAPHELQQGQVRLVVDKFALTANNVTYAAFGDAMNYWKFFPAQGDDSGRVPVWGFADVADSRCSELSTGERIYGFLPMSTELTVTPVSVSRSGFVDGSAHRKNLHLVYNQYSRVSGDPSYLPSREAQQMILRPLFMTSFLIDDFLRDNNYFGAARVILSSASSKTAIGVAWQIAQSKGRTYELVGLTSAGNRTFVENLGLYDTVVAYDDLETLDPDAPCVFVDMAGNSDVLSRLHTHLDDHLKYSCLVGASHWEANKPPAAMPGPRPEWFFAPAQFQKRVDETGAAALLQQFAVAWTAFVGSTDNWMQIVELAGEEAIQQTFNHMLAGTAPPSNAFILSF